jgi:transposase
VPFVLKKEEIVDIHILSKQGLSRRKIAEKLGHSRNTVKKCLERPTLEVPVLRRQRPSQLDPFTPSLERFLLEDPKVSAQWIFERLRPLGYLGSYEQVKRKVGGIKGERCKEAYEAFETLPGHQAQVDYGEFQVEEDGQKKRTYYLFAMILGYSRRLYAELSERCDLVGFLEAHIRAFEFFGGVPAEVLYDRMKNVYLGRLAGKERFNEALLSLAAHYGFKPLVAPPYAPWVKGKVERPFHFVRENFWRGYSFTSLERAGVDLSHWLKAKEERMHGTTHEVVRVRFERERPHLLALPPSAPDTSLKAYRTVRKDCTVVYEGNRFVVPHTLVGKQILLRVKGAELRVVLDDKVLVTYAIPEGKGHLVQDKRFYAALRKEREKREREKPRTFPRKARATLSPKQPPQGFEVEVRPVSHYDAWVGAA